MPDRLVPALVASLVLLAVSSVLGEDPRLRYSLEPGETFGYRIRVSGKVGGTELTTTGRVDYTVREVDRERAGLEAQEGSGTGFVVSADGVLVTCAHVVQHATRIDVVLGEKTYGGKVVGLDEGRDLAIVRIKAKGLPALPLAKSDEVELAQEVRAFGYPLSDLLGESIKVTRGSVSGIVRKGENRLFQIDAAVNSGNSGGPITANDGRVVGVTTSKLTGSEVSKVAFAVPIDDVRSLLEKHDVKYQSPERGAKREGPDLARRTSPAVALLKVSIDPVKARGGLVSLAYSGRLETTSLQQRRRGPRVVTMKGRPSVTRFEGRLWTNAFGSSESVEGDESLPFLVGPVGTCALPELSEDGARKWMVERTMLIGVPKPGASQPDRLPFGPRFGPRIGSRFGSRFGGRGEENRETALAIKPAIHRETCEVVDVQNGIATVRVEYEFTTLEKKGVEPTISATGKETVEFDRERGLVARRTYEGSLTVRLDGKSVEVPVEYSIERLDAEPAVTTNGRNADDDRIPKVSGEVTTIPFDDRATARLVDGPGMNPQNALSIPVGKLVSAGVTFEVEKGFVILKGTHNPRMPESVSGFPVGRTVARLHVLHATNWGGRPKLPDGTRIATYVLHYEDGSKHEFVVEYGRDVRDLWSWNVDDTKNARIGWIGDSPLASRNRVRNRLFHRAWDNPHPERPVASVEFRSAVGSASPLCVAMSVESPAKTAEP